MAEIPTELRYSKDHEWLRTVEDGIAVVGITDYAQETLGDITFVELPEPGDHFDAGDAFGVVESVKAANELYMPIAGEIVAVNEALEDAPEQVNDDAYGEGWMIRIRPDSDDFSTLLDAAGYGELT